MIDLTKNRAVPLQTSDRGKKKKKRFSPFCTGAKIRIRYLFLSPFPRKHGENKYFLSFSFFFSCTCQFLILSPNNMQIPPPLLSLWVKNNLPRPPPGKNDLRCLWSFVKVELCIGTRSPVRAAHSKSIIAGAQFPAWIPRRNRKKRF